MRLYYLAVSVMCFMLILGCQQSSREAAREKDREARGDDYREAPVKVPDGQQPQQQPPVFQQENMQDDGQAQDIPPDQVNITEKIDGKVWHFICANRCEGGVSDVSGSNCPVCGQMLSHNQGFHAQEGEQQQPEIQQQEQQIDVEQIQRQMQEQEPAQNQQGTWHYICPNGCSGGSGSPAACSTCGATLTHNDAYHK